MALNKRQKYIVMIVIVAIVALIAAWQLLVIVVTVETAPVVSERRSNEEMVNGYNDIKPEATQDDVLAVMGSNFAVEKCPPDADPNCAHIWHFQAEDQAWDFTFDMDGNLMAKKLGTVEQ